MAVIGEVLFMRSGGGDVGDVVRHVERQLQSHVDAYDERQFDTKSDDEVVGALEAELRVEPIVLDLENATKRVDETGIGVRDHFGGSATVPGLRVTKTLPFSGNPDLWQFGAGQWGSMMPRGEVYGRTITIGMEVRATEGEAAATHINSTVEQITHYIGLQTAVLDPFNASLSSRLLPLVQARRARRDQAKGLLDRF